MDKVKLYRQVFSAFKELCASGKQPGSFSDYCREHGVSQCQMPIVLKGEFQLVQTITGYRRLTGKGLLYSQIYDDFKELCAEGKQPGTFQSFCDKHGVTRKQIHNYLNSHKLKVVGLPGYSEPIGHKREQYQEVLFEDIIFEEAGFLPSTLDRVITVKVDGHVTVSFPSDTDIDVIAKFVDRTRKEAGYVGA